MYLNTSGGAAPTRAVNVSKTAVVAYDDRTDTYDCAEILASHRGFWNHFCYVSVQDCRLTLRCYGHRYYLTGEDPTDVYVIDRCL